MALITDLELNTSGLDSRPIINTNFDNLNTDKAELSGDTFTGLIDFSGTDHYGIRLNNLTTAQRDALASLNGHSIYNTSTNQIEFFENGTWVNLSGVADATTTVKGIVEEATEAEVVAGTVAGGTAARLFVNPGSIVDKILTAIERTWVRTVAAVTTEAEVNQLAGTTNIAEADTFFGNTDMTGAEAETLSSGPTSDADALHTHGGLGAGALFVGVGAPSDKTFNNFGLSYTDTSLWTDAVNLAGIETASDFMFLLNTDVAGSRVTTNALASTGITASVLDPLLYSDLKRVIVEFTWQQFILINESKMAGFGADANLKAPGDVTASGALFLVDASGLLKARTIDGTGGTSTEETIAGVTLTDKTVFRIDLIPGTSAKFYVDGVLKETIVTNVPDDGDEIKWGYGATGNTNTGSGNASIFLISRPTFAVIQ